MGPACTATASNMAMVCTNEPDGQGQCRAITAVTLLLGRRVPKLIRHSRRRRMQNSGDRFRARGASVGERAEDAGLRLLDDAAINQADAGLYTGKRFGRGIYADAGRRVRHVYRLFAG